MNFNNNQSIIPTKKKRTRYTFIGNQGADDVREPKDDGTTKEYFQLCSYADPTSNRYHMRKFTINGINEFSNIKDYRLKKKECKKFIQIRKPHEYKMYSQYDLNNVAPPNMQEVCTAKSNILCNDYDYTGYAPF